ERRGIAASVLCHLTELRQHLERIDAAADRNPAVAVCDRPSCCVGECAPNDDRRVRFLNRFGPLHHGFKLDAFAVECRRRLRPDLLHRLDPLTHQLEAGCKRSAVIGHLFLVPTPANAENEPARGKPVDGRYLFGGVNWITLDDKTDPRRWWFSSPRRQRRAIGTDRSFR